MTGWGQKGDLCNGDVLFLILVVVGYLGMFTLRKVTELNTYDSHTFCMYIIHNKFIKKSCNDPPPSPPPQAYRVKSKFIGSSRWPAQFPGLLSSGSPCVCCFSSGFLQLIRTVCLAVG